MRNKVAKSIKAKSKNIIGNAPFQIPSQGEVTDKVVIRNEYKRLKAGYRFLNHKERGRFNALVK